MSTVKAKLENKKWLGGEKIETMARAESLMVKGKEKVIKSRKVFCFCFVIVVVVLGQGRSILQISVNSPLAPSTDGLQNLHCSAPCHWNESSFMAYSDEYRIQIRGLVGLVSPSIGHSYLKKAFVQLSLRA